MNPIAAKRLISQQIEQAHQTSPSSLVEWMGAVQGQDYPGGLWTLGLRLPGSTEEGVESAFLQKKIFRTWALRGTLHFVAARDIHWMLSLQRSRQIARNARRYKELELDEKTMLRSNSILTKTLVGRTQTRKELLRTLEEKGISTRGQRAPYLLQRASLDRLICQSVTKRNDPTYMLLSDAVPEPRDLSREEAVAELAKRYFFSHGPATLQDFIWWSGLVSGDARAGLEEVKPHLVSETISGEIYWMRPDLPKRSSRGVYLLSSFDEYLVSYRSREAMIDDEQRSLMLIGKPTLIVDGRVAGTWKRALKKDSVVVALSMFRTLEEAEKQLLAKAVERYGKFLRKEVRWQA